LFRVTETVFGLSSLITTVTVLFALVMVNGPAPDAVMTLADEVRPSVVLAVPAPRFSVAARLRGAMTRTPFAATLAIAKVWKRTSVFRSVAIAVAVVLVLCRLAEMVTGFASVTVKINVLLALLIVKGPANELVITSPGVGLSVGLLNREL